MNNVRTTSTWPVVRTSLTPNPLCRCLSLVVKERSLQEFSPTSTPPLHRWFQFPTTLAMKLIPVISRALQYEYTKLRWKVLAEGFFLSWTNSSAFVCVQPHMKLEFTLPDVRVIFWQFGCSCTFKRRSTEISSAKRGTADFSMSMEGQQRRGSKGGNASEDPRGGQTRGSPGKVRVWYQNSSGFYSFTPTPWPVEVSRSHRDSSLRYPSERPQYAPIFSHFSAWRYMDNGCCVSHPDMFECSVMRKIVLLVFFYSVQNKRIFRTKVLPLLGSLIIHTLLLENTYSAVNLKILR